MKRNAFGEVIIEPTDDPYYVFADVLDVDMSDNLLGYRFAEEDPNFGWCCEIESEGGTAAQVHGFADLESLKNWMEQHSIESID